ncbi:hypothetical protein CCAN12_740084 [Capnocytophaga canimorsus]|uniref:Uncharacterized protein n=1 Tax=Capnocytophaga canimorsus TaxID=28188 RepID=A0A0B7I795_9FLAO|nr:hypothetical protein CCAN12_740084 [Capnocytophaga canimorsus]CEN46564.1 hypothetical protein CCAN2_1720023 [Capnocytophaga canimorsus]CEN51551.1 hypothetical protein CCAN11_2320028 [Capnocytophaga canimorsus]
MENMSRRENNMCPNFVITGQSYRKICYENDKKRGSLLRIFNSNFGIAYVKIMINIVLLEKIFNYVRKYYKFAKD